ncbi:hypothetical protein [Amycolatopsis vastitatis]|uniref:hypothetical protein n=1 Tax=Amycolatopsis vastitatis TaxID=1905142 RepID=UPI001177ED4B|nr:hypothetical protein [Amycolatopsis vastitatis]
MGLKWSIGISAVVACLAAAAIIFVVTRTTIATVPSHTATAKVTDQGVSLSVDEVTVAGPPGIAPAGATLSATTSTDAPFGAAAAMFTGAGGTLELSLSGGLQPAQPLSVTFPVTGPVPESAAATVLTNPSGTTGTHLIPASFDPARRTITAQVDHLSKFWPGFFNFGALTGNIKNFLGQTTGITAAKPDCAGQAANGPDGTTVTLGGDINGAPVWPCVRIEDGKAVVTLTGNSPLPWRIRAAPAATLNPPGTVDASKALVLAGYDTLVKTRPYAEGLLIPGVPLTYRLPAAKLPGVVAGQADVGTYLGMALLFGLDEALTVFGVNLGQIGTSADALRCLGDAVDAAKLGTHPRIDAIAGLTKAVLSCIGAVGHDVPGPIKVVIGILTTGISLVAAGLQGAVLTLTGKDTFTINLTPHPPPITLTTFAAEWGGHTRLLAITKDGLATEHIDDGCCTPVIDLTFRLSQPRGTPEYATATATVTSVTLLNWPTDLKAPTVGQTGTLKLRHGVITEPFSGTTYCSLTEQVRNTCGA